MTLAERNWKYHLQSGNLGVFGNFFQDFTKITADHVYSVGDGLLVVDSTAGEVIITLPAINSWPESDHRIIIPIMHIAGTNNVKVRMVNEYNAVYYNTGAPVGKFDLFKAGCTYFNLGSDFGNMEFYLINSETFEACGILGGIKIEGGLVHSSNWASGGFVNKTSIPFTTKGLNTQNELLHVQTRSNGAIGEVLSNDDGDLVIGDVAHGLAVGDYIDIAGTTSYNGSAFVKEVPGADTFVVSGTYVADETGTWIRPAMIQCNFAGTITVSAVVQLDSSGGGAWSCVAGLETTGAASAPETFVEMQGAAGENKTLVIPKTDIEVSFGDYIDVYLDHNNLTGNMTNATLQVERIVY